MPEKVLSADPSPKTDFTEIIKLVINYKIIFNDFSTKKKMRQNLPVHSTLVFLGGCGKGGREI